MKTALLCTVFFLLAFFSNSIAQSYGLDNSDPAVFTKFRVPASDLRSLWLNTNINFNSSKHIAGYESGNSTYNNDAYNSTFNFNLNPKYLWLRETDDKYINVSASFQGAFNNSYSENHTSTSTVGNSNKTNEYSAVLTLNATDKTYVNSGSVFYSIGSVVSINLSDRKTENNSLTITRSYSGNKSQSYRVSFGTGFGKLRNVTPVVTALRFQERMKQVNIIDSDLSEKTIEDLAEQFYRQDYYSQVHVRPSKYFWQSIDQTLADDGISLKDLNMYADAYIQEAPGEIRFLRQEGFMTGIDLLLNYQNYYYASSGGSSISEQLFTLAEIYLNYSHQLNLNSQLSFDLSLSGGPNLISQPTVRQVYYIAGTMGYFYELTDRLVTSATDNFNINFYNREHSERYIANTFGLNLNYFVEDNLSLNASYSWTFSGTRFFTPYNKNESNTNNLRIGFTYYPMRGLLIN